ncbi:MAG: hypothetical protein Athens071416_290 [Parcubacteria group bacterium Athens0714_16]|nr:MAG: hypothetical protein Athens071416_290 [Parcubacteria group bacterium Athens0714_16]
MIYTQLKIHSVFYVLIISFVLGVFFRSFFNFGLFFLLFLILMSILVSLFYILFCKQNINILFVAIFILFFGFGVFRFSLYDEYKGSEITDSLVEQKITAEGIITDEPIEKEKSIKFIVKLDKVISFDGETKVKDRVLIITDLPSLFKYGDEVVLRGILIKPKNFSSNDREFDYVSYLSKDKIFYQMFRPEIKLKSEGGGNYIKEVLFSVKNSFLKSIKKIIPEPHASLLGGLTVGAQESLGEELQNNFRKTGIAHIVVLSGYNVTIVSEAIMRVFGFLPMVFKFSLGALAIIFFVLMTGASATAVRAGIMAVLVIIARVTGREYDALRALLIAGVVMIIQNPKILAFDSSFQLSFMATLGLLYVSPRIYKYFKFITTKFQFRELVVSAIATQLFVLPLILYKMGNLSILALPVNLLILPFIPITMFFGFVSGVIGFLGSAIAFPFSFITFLFLDYELKIVNFFANIPFSSIQINNFPVVFMVLIYIIYGVILFLINKNKKNVPKINL